MDRARKYSSLRRVAFILLIFASALVGLLLLTSSSYLPRFQLRQPVKTIYAHSPSYVESHFSPPDPHRKDYHEWNAMTVRDLHVCIAQQNCGPNQEKVALLAAHWFQEAVVTGFRGGEGIWAISVYENLRALGYTTLFAIDFSKARRSVRSACLDVTVSEEALAQYRMMPDLVKVVIRNMAGDCHSDPQCVKGPDNPSGIPAWKIFDFEYFPSEGNHWHASLMKGQWILSADVPVTPAAEPIQYIGYSVEKTCAVDPVYPLAQRKDRAWLLMKQLAYVYDHQFAWSRPWFTNVSQELGLVFTGAWKTDTKYGTYDSATMGEMTDIEDRDHGVVNLGVLNQGAFSYELRQSKVLVGVGNPYWSPSPYNALCQGVPFINPIFDWDEDNPSDRKRWYSQHPALSQYDPPYVYNVHAGSYEGFVGAIRQASSTEIGRHIFPHMTEAAVQERLKKLMETDWKAEAATLLEKRRRDGGYTFEL